MPGDTGGAYLAWTKYFLMNGYVEFSLGLWLVHSHMLSWSGGRCLLKGQETQKMAHRSSPCDGPSSLEEVGDGGGLGVSSVR